MKVPGFLRKAESTGNEVDIPLTRGRLGLVELLKRTFKEVGEDHLGAFAGNLTYKGLFALFPFFVFLLSLLGLFGATGLVTDLVDRLSTVLPASATEFISKQLLGIAQNEAQSAFTFGAIVSILLALWGVSGAFRSVMEAMNVVYEVEEGRPFWKKYAISIFISLSVALLLITALVLIVFGLDIGRTVADVVGLGAVFEVLWSVLQWPVLLVFVLLAFALVYYFAPDVEQRFRWVSPGAIAAVVLWLLFSLAFSFYVNTIGGESFSSYGALASVAIFMLYLYYTAFIVLVGAEMNQVIEEHIPEGKSEGEKSANGGAGSNGGSDENARTGRRR
jgi:membrane protein